MIYVRFEDGHNDPTILAFATMEELLLRLSGVDLYPGEDGPEALSEVGGVLYDCGDTWTRVDGDTLRREAAELERLACLMDAGEGRLFR